MVLKSYYPLNESSGSTAYDHSGNENHGAINAGALGQPSVAGSTGLKCTSSLEYVALPWYFDSVRSHSLTVNLWFKRTSTTTSQRRRIVSHDASEYYRMAVDNGDIEWYGRESSSTGQRIYSPNSVPVDEWVMWTGIIDSDKGELRLYKNGEQVSSTSGSYSTWGSGITRYGFLMDGSEATNFNGSRNGDYARGVLSEVRYYYRPLTTSEIQYLYSVSQRGLQTTSKKSS
ncbi:LamG domain-containing protein [Candidatus Nanosalina sp. VS9-1]|uniref:LamG domain-containing protein n=1 Tax=Candidatus Nanosalina sp. VS9-1 TaxID=3388566 RepID=UPI0039E1BAA4